MAWHAKPSGGYSINGTEGRENAIAIANMLQIRNYTLEAQAGVIGNVMAESALNPWRWQSDVVDRTGGYGLFQYTPASGYLNGATNVYGYAPNLSVSGQTAGASPNDGTAQVIVFDENILGKWNPYCWRSYWSTSTYAELYARSRTILRTYGNGSTLTMAQFRRIDNLYDATFAFLACFEGPAIPNMDARYKNAEVAYELIGGTHPVEPTDKRGMPLMFYLKTWF